MPTRGCGRSRKQSNGNWPCWKTCIQDQRRALSATELQGELDGLARTQTELRRHLEHLLARRQAHTWGARSAREDSNGTKLGFSAADAEQLESRRLELEQERFRLLNKSMQPRRS